MTVVSILVTEALTASSTKEPISSHSRTHKIPVLRRARALPRAPRVNNGHSRHLSLSTGRSALALAILLIAARVHVELGHSGGGHGS
jgi:hypothetical protein